MGTQETHLGDTGLLFIIIAAFEDTDRLVTAGHALV